MLLQRFIIASAVLGLILILLALYSVRRGWARASQRLRRQLEAGRILRRAERVRALVSQEVMGRTASAEVAVALVLTDSELHVFRHVDGDLARPANGPPFRVSLAAPPTRDGSAVELRLAGAVAVTWRLIFADDADAQEWLALLGRIAPPAADVRAR
jgi:hypothetical protein